MTGYSDGIVVTLQGRKSSMQRMRKTGLYACSLILFWKRNISWRYISKKKESPDGPVSEQRKEENMKKMIISLDVVW
jgi:hypothetical protein